MRAIRTAITFAVATSSVTVVMVVTAPAGGAAPGHRSCQGFGALTASEAHDKTVASELHSLPRGTVDDLIAVVQVGGSFGGEDVPAFCVLK